ncbi:MAG: PilW family protein [Coxiellaceae bacterium]|nr:MAG: PilW family protein [Coxiellaceae bacterium]
MNHINKFRGHTLVELLIASALSLLILSYIWQVYSHNRASVRWQQALARLQENGRMAEHFLRQSVRMAGYASCGGVIWNTDQTNAIRGYIATDVPSELSPRISSSADAVAITNCRYMVQQWQNTTVYYFIADTGRKNKQGRSVYALYEKLGTQGSEELVDNITDMRIFYGVSDSNSVDIAAYLTADQVADWSQVRAVVINLLLNTEEEILPASAQYWYLSQYQQATDKRFYQPWQIYIMLREREFTS